MKKTTGIFLVMSLVFAVSLSAFSQTDDSGSMSGKMMKDKTAGKEIINKNMKNNTMGMCSKQGMMSSMMEGIVATNDGGVVVISGNRLLKYDKDLNLQKEVELRMDTETMEMRGQMKAKYPMRHKMMKKNMMNDNDR